MGNLWAAVGKSSQASHRIWAMAERKVFLLGGVPLGTMMLLSALQEKVLQSP